MPVLFTLYLLFYLVKYLLMVFEMAAVHYFGFSNIRNFSARGVWRADLHPSLPNFVDV